MIEAALIAAGTVAAGGALRWAVHRGFRPLAMAETTTPEAFGRPYRRVRVPTANGKTLFGWLLPGRSGVPAIVMMHGWGANADTLLPLAAPLARAGHTVLLVDARSHGRSDADTFSSMPRFAEDIEAAMAWLAACPEFAPRRIALFGHSVGAAAALLVASRRCDVAAAISLAAFDHPERVMRRQLSQGHIPYWPLGWLVCRYVERVIGHSFDAIAPVNTVARIHCPVLIGHGADDTVVPWQAAAAIHANAGANARMLILEHTGHERPASFDHLAALLGNFLADALAEPTGPA